MLIIVVFGLSAAIVCAVALWRGGMAERWGAALIAVSWLFVTIAQGFSHSILPMIWVLTADIALATGFLLIALRYSSLWLGAAMMFQGSEIAAHAAFMSGWVARVAYVWWLDAMSLLVLASILGGTLASWRRRTVARPQLRDGPAVR